LDIDPECFNLAHDGDHADRVIWSSFSEGSDFPVCPMSIGRAGAPQSYADRMPRARSVRRLGPLARRPSLHYQRGQTAMLSARTAHSYWRWNRQRRTSDWSPRGRGLPLIIGGDRAGLGGSPGGRDGDGNMVTGRLTGRRKFERRASVVCLCVRASSSVDRASIPPLLLPPIAPPVVAVAPGVVVARICIISLVTT
jgi:hypothetical protein